MTLVFFGGTIGTGLRFLVYQLFIKFDLSFVGMVSINVFGSFLLGLLVGFFKRHSISSESWLLFVGTGILGSFTTFSLFILDVSILIDLYSPTTALSYVSVSLFLSLFGAIIGLKIFKESR